jgi:nucleoside-diphosphate-sugar epimerase
MLHALVTGVEALLSAAAELATPPAVVHLGSGLEFAPQDRPVREDDPLVPSASRYGAAKAAGAAALGSFAGLLPITLMRPFNVYGAGDTAPRLGTLIIERSRKGEPVEVTAGEQVRDFLHVDDCARAIWLAADPADEPFRVLNLGSGEPRPLRDYIAAIGAALTTAGHAPDIRYGAVAYRPGEPMLSAPDVSRLHAALAWGPRVPFADGVADFVQWSLARCA